MHLNGKEERGNSDVSVRGTTEDERAAAIKSTGLRGYERKSTHTQEVEPISHSQLYKYQVSSMSHSSPSTHRSADSLPLTIPHSKASSTS